MNICVYSSSSDVIEPVFFAAAAQLGAAVARRGDILVYGGCSIGLMGAVARAAQQNGGRVIGIIPTFMHQRGLTHAHCDELILTETMRERKALMEARSDAFIALPGGFGTLEEMLEVITLKQLQRHRKPVLFLDVERFYAPLQLLFEHILEHRFAKPAYRDLYAFVPDVASGLAYLDQYQPPQLVSKWSDTGSAR